MLRVRLAIRAVGLLLVAALAVPPVASASIIRTETHTVLTAQGMQYFIVEEFRAADAESLRAQADTDIDGNVSAAEAAAFAENETARRQQNATLYVKWDGAAPVWTNLTSTVQGLEGATTSGALVTVTLDGVVALSPAPGENHTLTVTQPNGFASWTLTLNIPPGWSFGNVTGVVSATQNGSTMTAVLGVGVAVFPLFAPVPPPPSTVRREETYTFLNDTALQYYFVEESTGDLAAAQRARADIDTDGNVTVVEALDFLAAASARGLRNSTLYIKWDAVEPVWKSLAVSGEGFVGPADALGPARVIHDGVVTLLSSLGSNHTLTVARPTGFEAWSVTVDVPSGWSFGNVSGPAAYNQTGSRLTADVPVGVAVFAFVTPPVLPPDNPGGASTVPTSPSSWLSTFGIPAALIGVLVAAGVAIGSRRRRAASHPDPSAPGVSEEARHPYVLEGLLLLYRDGRLIHHQSAGTVGKLDNPEVVGSMFTAITEFIRDSFHDEGSLSRLSYGQNTITLDRGRHLFAAAITYGEPDASFREILKETLRRIESAHTGVIERWTGSQEDFAGVSALVTPLFALTAGVTRADVRASVAEKTVKLLSETEHYRGYLRVKVALANDTNAPIREAAVTVDFNEDVLRLARVEPASFQRTGTMVRIGDVKPGERVCVNYYLDPQTCNQTDIEGRGSYLDASASRRMLPMKTRHAEIVCPIFFTPEHANAATLKRLIDTSLSARDTRIYSVVSLPEGASFRELFAIAREAVQRHDVRLVRNAATQDPFEGKAWLYGETKPARKKVIIRVAALEADKKVEFFVAADAASALTGLLAEVNHSFAELVAKRMPGAKIEPVLEEAPAPPVEATAAELTNGSADASAAPSA